MSFNRNGKIAFVVQFFSKTYKIGAIMIGHVFRNYLTFITAPEHSTHNVRRNTDPLFIKSRIRFSSKYFRRIHAPENRNSEESVWYESMLVSILAYVTAKRVHNL